MARLREQLLSRERDIAELTGQIATLTQQLDDCLDREAMYVFDARRECLTSAACLERFALPRAQHPIVQDATLPHGLDAAGTELPAHLAPVSVRPHAWDVLVTRPASRVRRRGQTRTAAHTSAAAVRVATRIPMHDSRRIAARVLALMITDLYAGLRVWLTLATAPVVLWAAAKCTAPPAHTPHLGGAR
ncbi:hypothetical protein [Nocardia jejuensis]|uniref:hypothetical protein n=1 Tax=Nocardia jejuensis TaxID=328049 RepID=UPI000830DF67|nr:hypothetical protein [Nocardia jejuensis]